MTQELSELEKKLRNNLDRSKKVAICSHVDADGIMSAALTAQYLIEQGIDFEFFSVNNTERNLELSQYKQIMSSEYDSVVFTDVSPRKINQIKNLLNGGKFVAVLDHHGHELHDLNTYEKGVLINGYPDRVDEFGLRNASDTAYLSLLDNSKDFKKSRAWMLMTGLQGDMLEFPDNEYEEIVLDMFNTVGLSSLIGESITAADNLQRKLVGYVLEAQNETKFYENKQINILANKLIQDVEVKNRYDEIVEFRDLHTKALLDVQEQAQQYISEKVGDIFAKLDTNFGANATIHYDNGNIIIDYRIEGKRKDEKPKYEVTGAVLKKTIESLEPNITIVLSSPNVGNSSTFVVYRDDKIISVNCKEICTYFGGGGHEKRGGFTTIEPRENIANRAVEKIKSMYQK
ncbi:DHH family phosphoesterase [archaeon]|jgi:single-stranded DNA-specific DHH superfamily exonuclease|nr:DHH family phosphoesterase [archaeon]MBT4648314.1 DHH family phosphoesterase [archaeon]MBT6822303.1 DHH family phosphoesterase [archaeon]MBT7391802.1 DHH family phosphoesterase [archaeon]